MFCHAEQYLNSEATPLVLPLMYAESANPSPYVTLTDSHAPPPHPLFFIYMVTGYIVSSTRK